LCIATNWSRHLISTLFTEEKSRENQSDSIMSPSNKIQQSSNIETYNIRLSFEQFTLQVYQEILPPFN
jgi:hypothetical protein